MPDTTENQKEYPQLRGQKAGCGFTIIRCVIMSCLGDGAASDVSCAPYAGKKTGGNSLLQLLLNLVSPGNVLLGDLYYASYWNIEHAYRNKYDVIFRSHHKRNIDFRRGRKQGSCDQVVVYHRPKKRPVWMTKEEHGKCDAFALVHHVRFEVATKGSRTTWITLAITLLDAAQYNASDLADIYRCR